MKLKIFALVAVLAVMMGFVTINLQGLIISPLDLLGFTEVDIDTDPGVIYLSHNCYTVSMATTDTQTESIESGILSEIPVRPTAHDLAREILEAYNISVLMVKVTDYNNGTYYSRLILKKGDKVLDLDSKPSDAIAIAVRMKSPVYAKQALLEQVGVRTC